MGAACAAIASSSRGEAIRAKDFPRAEADTYVVDRESTLIVGTTRVKRFTGDISALASAGRSLVFAGPGGLWRSDGTEAGTVLIKSLSAIRYVTSVGSVLYFAAGDDAGVELWKSDGTSAGTTLVRDLRPGPPSSYPRELTAAGDTVFFVLSAPGGGQELWRSDGTVAGTTLVQSFSATNGFIADDYATYLTSVNGTLFFRVARENLARPELWKSDGTAAGTMLIRALAFGERQTANPLEQLRASAGGKFFFMAIESVGGLYERDLWRSDGTPNGTFMLMDIMSPGGGGLALDFTESAGKLFFSRDRGLGKREIWLSDGTPANTHLLFSFEGVPSDPLSVIDAGGTLFFGGHRIDGLWKSDGTPAGTVRVSGGVELGQMGPVARDRDMALVNGTVFFRGRDAIHGLELWRSDGTESGAMLVKDLSPGVMSPVELTSVNGTLFLCRCGTFGRAACCRRFSRTIGCRAAGRRRWR